MLQYLINTSLIWFLSLVLFEVFLRKENFHNYNRFYLMFTFLLGVILPLWQQTGNGSNFSIIAARLYYASGENWLQCLIIIYISGAAIALFLLLSDIIKLLSFYKPKNKSNQDGWTIIETGKEHPPFSYLDILFVTNIQKYSPGEWAMITAHEKQHSILLHLIDMFLLQLARVLFWFNPLVYVYNYHLLLVHEYQADRAASKEPQEYGRFLIEQAVLKNAPLVSQPFNRSPIKNRIVMLTKNKSPRTGKSNLKLLVVLPLTLFCLLAFTKNSYSENKLKQALPPYKKMVSRIIDVTQKEDNIETHLKDVSPDTTFAEMMANAVISGKVTAYRNYDTHLTDKLRGSELSEMLTGKSDTVTIADPVTNKEQIKVIKHYTDFSRIHKFRVLEEWTYNWSTGKTEVETIGFAPLLDITIEGKFRGYKALFYLQYVDARKIIDRYELFHPSNPVSSLIWNDYFNPGEPSSMHQ